MHFLALLSFSAALRGRGCRELAAMPLCSTWCLRLGPQLPVHHLFSLGSLMLLRCQILGNQWRPKPAMGALVEVPPDLDCSFLHPAKHVWSAGLCASRGFRFTTCAPLKGVKIGVHVPSTSVEACRKAGSFCLGPCPIGAVAGVGLPAPSTVQLPAVSACQLRKVAGLRTTGPALARIEIRVCRPRKKLISVL